MEDEQPYENVGMVRSHTIGHCMPHRVTLIEGFTGIVRGVMSKVRNLRSQKLAEALKERERFLSRHPELRKLQKEIDRRLKNAATDHNRLVVIHDLMMDSFLELDSKLQTLVARLRGSQQVLPASWPSIAFFDSNRGSLLVRLTGGQNFFGWDLDDEFGSAVC